MPAVIDRSVVERESTGPAICPKSDYAAPTLRPVVDGAVAAHHAFLGVRMFGALDGLRCACILAVIWHHTAFGRLGWTVLDERGYFGVDMFFAISGFLIVTLLLRERRRTGRVSLRGFYARRALRIFPLYYGLIGALGAAVLLLGPGSTTRAALEHDLPYLLTYTGNWVTLASLLAVTWSLAVEEQFYLCWPPLEKWLGPGTLIGVLAAVLAATQAVNFGLADGLLAAVGLPPAARHVPTATPILLGVGLAHLLNSARGFAWARAWAGWRGSPVLAAMALVLLAAVPGAIVGWRELAVHLCMVWLLAACVVREDHALMPLLRLGPVARIGVISCGMYLLHMFCLHGATVATERLGLQDPLWLLVSCLLLTVLAAEVSFRFYERPFLRLKAGLSWRARAPREHQVTARPVFCTR